MRWLRGGLNWIEWRRLRLCEDGMSTVLKACGEVRLRWLWVIEVRQRRGCEKPTAGL